MNQKKAEKLLGLANKKKIGRKIKLDHVLAIALDLVTEDHVRRMQDQSLSNEDQKEQLRQRYIEIRGPISRDDFIGFMLTKDFLNLWKSNQRQRVLHKRKGGLH